MFFEIAGNFLLDFLVKQNGIIGGGIAYMIYKGNRDQKNRSDFRNEILKTLKEGSNDVSENKAKQDIYNLLRDSLHILSLKIEKIESDESLRSDLVMLEDRYKSAWSATRRTMLASLEHTSFQGRSVNVYLGSTLQAWENERDFILKNLHLIVQGNKAHFDSIEIRLIDFRDSLYYGAEQWLKTGLNYMEKTNLEED